VGVAAEGAPFEKRALWQLGFFRETDDFGFDSDDWGNGNWNLTTRLAGVPLYAEEGKQVVHLGASYSHQWRDAAAGLRYSQRPEAHLATRYLDTQLEGADLSASDADLFNVELAGVLGSLSAQAEFTGSGVALEGGSDPFFWGAYGQLSWFLTGERRPYDLGKGRFGRLVPKASFDPAAGGWGAWEIAARYSYLDLADAGVQGGEQWDVTGGLNWYLFPNMRIMLNYVHFDVSDRLLVAGDPDVDGHGDLVETRLQVDF
jgi:phosphate-selective porin OprO/OprP